ncbi:TetR/AcrR family transcriptional regulator [Nocardia callitridis]|uniref:TetR/AcrR family transcriptional regulator n=1 Tax=Nocardia callitridis TaxID=648753 RepID=A0ABP9KYY6_9NOCA
MARVLSTAQERATVVIDAALRVFAEGGYRGTPVTAVAAAAGISPAYVFRLFPTKREVFIAALHECFDRIIDALGKAVRQGSSEEPAQVLEMMVGAYARLIADRHLLMLQVHALAASDEPEIRAALKAEQDRLVSFVAERSHADQPALQGFFARGQLCHMVAVLGIEGDQAPWARILADGLTH